MNKQLNRDSYSPKPKIPTVWRYAAGGLAVACVCAISFSFGVLHRPAEVADCAAPQTEFVTVQVRLVRAPEWPHVLILECTKHERTGWGER